MLLSGLEGLVVVFVSGCKQYFEHKLVKGIAICIA